ncbi:hypothetical protein QJQ45_028482, partial [Haematococcus lacustris]
VQPPNVSLDQALAMQFDKTMLGMPRPTPQRQAMLDAQRHKAEDYGLYTERQALLGMQSLVKMEQRVIRAVRLDKGMLREMSKSMAESRTAAGRTHMHRTRQQQQAATQQLTIGALPSLAEEPEEGLAHSTASHPPATQPPHPQPHPPQPGAIGVLGAPPASTPWQQAALQQSTVVAAPQLMQDPGQAWQALMYHQTGLTQLGAQEPSHPSHALLQAVQAALQQMSTTGTMPMLGLDGLPLTPEAASASVVGNQAALPAVATGQAVQLTDWLDDTGLLRYEPDPTKTEKERPARRYDQDRDATRTFVRRPVVEVSGAAAEAEHLYRLDIELSRLEFQVHPSMSREDVLAARLLAMFKEFKRRESVGLATFYANKLAALEESLLAARDHLFQLSEEAAAAEAMGPVAAAAIAAQGGAAGISAAAAQAAAEPQSDGLSPALRAALQHTSKVEKEVVETRQLKEEEEVFMRRCVDSMQGLYAAIVAERHSQGFCLTNLELSVQQQAPEEVQWSMVGAVQQGGAGVPRDLLDAQLLVAEEAAIAGLPPAPYPFPPPPAMEDLPLTGFKPRRLEMMCASHKALVAELSNRLATMKGRPSADPRDPVILQLEDQLAALGKAPRCLGPRTPQDQAQALLNAQQRVLAGQVGVVRLPRLVPILTVQPQQAQGPAPDAAAYVSLPPYTYTATASLATQQPWQQTGAELQMRPRALAAKGSAVASKSSVQVVRWPESIMVQLFERGAVRDTALASVYVGVPGLMGSPHVDPRPMAYQFTSQAPYRTLVQGAGQPSPPGSPGREVCGPLHDPGLVYPAGVVFIRCGWVNSQAAPSAHMTEHGAGVTFLNPLADVRDDAENPQRLMPPVPIITVDRLLRRAAERIGGKASRHPQKPFCSLLLFQTNAQQQCTCQAIPQPASRQQVLKWISQNTIDPNDPANAPLLELMRAHEASSGGLGDVFRLDDFPDIAIPQDRNQGKRSTFLNRRWAAGPFRDPERSVLKGQRQVRIPAVLSGQDVEELEHMYLDALTLVESAPGGSGPAVARALQARQERATHMQVGPELTSGIEEREARLKEYALRIRAAANRVAGGIQAGRRYKTEDVINDTPLPQFKVDFVTLTQLFAPRRPLKRERKLIKTLVTSVPPDTKLMVTIQRATNLPVRRNQAAASPQRGGLRGRARDARLPDQDAVPLAGSDGSTHAFVEVRFRGSSRRTLTCCSSHPIFNEQVLLPVFTSDEEPSPSALYENNDVVAINVFDEVVHDRVGEPRVLRTNREDAISDPVRYPERERRFLGGVRVPLSAIYQMQVLDGTFKLEVPPVMLGYALQSEQPPCITMYLSFRPALAPPCDQPETGLSGEQEDVTRHAKTWVAELQGLAQCSTRVLRAMAVDTEGTSLLITRYIAATPLPPTLSVLAGVPPATPLPVAVSNTELFMLKVARTVALLPYLEDSALQKRRVDVWSSSAEAVALAAGDAEEHAHLLAGWFLEVGQQALVVLGASTVGGKSAFVLTTGQAAYADPRNPTAGAATYDWDVRQLRLWNPLMGSCVSVLDCTGDMREVGCVYDHSNIWANVQADAHPWAMSWRLADPRMFTPFFGPRIPPRVMGTIQNVPAYGELPDRFYEQLEARVEEAVRDCLQKARALGAFLTKPDNKVSRLLRALLKDMPGAMESIAAANLASSLALAAQAEGAAPAAADTGLGDRHRVIKGLQDMHNERVMKESRADWVCGHILALPFSDRYADAVTEAVLNTGIHRIADERVKYSMAAHVERSGIAFCSCLWIYVAALR